MTKITKENARLMLAKIKSKNTKPEVIISDKLTKGGFSFVQHFEIAGKPDFVFLDKKIAIFIDGDFWHGFTLVKKRSSLPTKWIEKIERNIKRDKETNKILKKMGWKVMRLWEHEVRKKNAIGLKKLLNFLERNVHLKK